MEGSGGTGPRGQAVGTPTAPVPAVHLLALGVPPVLETLDIVEEQPDHGIRLVQVPLHLCRLLWGLPSRQQPHVLRGRDSKATASGMAGAGPTRPPHPGATDTHCLQQSICLVQLLLTEP